MALSGQSDATALFLAVRYTLCDTNIEKSIWSEKAISSIFKPLKMVFCSSCVGVPLKFKKKNGWASSLPARIIWA